METELIKIKVEDDQQLVSERELYKALEVKKRFSVWKEQNFKDFEEGTDFMSVTGVTDMPTSGQSFPTCWEKNEILRKWRKAENIF